MPAAAFDFDGYRAAFEAKDVAAWIAYYADDAVWLEFSSQRNPPHEPNVMRGAGAIRVFMEHVAALPISLALSREVIGDERIAFVCTVDLGSGRLIVEHVIADVRDGRIVLHVDVEAWD